MKSDFKAIYPMILTVLAVSVGVVTLLSMLIDNAVLDGLRAVFVEWSVIVLAAALLFGVFNVMRVHVRRIQSGHGAGYSLVLITSFLVVFVFGILPPVERMAPEVQRLVGPNGTIVDFAFRYVQRPLQATIFALMGFLVFSAAWRVFRVRSAATIVMFIAVLLVLLGSIRLDFGGGWTLPTEIGQWVMSVPVKAGARGILLGITLATVVAGARLLLGMERPYSE